MKPQESERLRKWFIPSLGDFLFLFVFLSLVRMLPTSLYADGGTGWHLATGRYITETGRIPFTEFISYTFPNQPWISQYWFSDLIMYWIQKALGYNGLAVCFAGCYAGFFLLLYHQCRKEGAGALIVWILTVLGACVASVQFLARPIVVTWFMIGLVAVLLDKHQRGQLSGKKLWLLFLPGFSFWANCHSGYIIGVTQVCIYLAYNTLAAALHSNAEQRKLIATKATDLIAGLICALVGVTLTPYGLALHSNIFETLGNRSMIDSVEEFKSPSFHGGIQTSSLELLFASIIAALAVTRAQCSWPRALTVVAFCHLALYSIRNGPVLVIICLPFVCNLLSQTRLFDVIGESNTEEQKPLARKMLDHIMQSCRRIDGQEVLNGYHLLPAATMVLFLLISANGGKIGEQQFLTCWPNRHHFPTKTLNAVQRLKLKADEGFNHVNWGGYIFYESNLPVYIDDRGTFFENFYVRYGEIVSLFPGWQERLKRDGINWVVYRKSTDFANALKADSDWQIAEEDDASYLFLRKTPVVPSQPRVFRKDVVMQ